MFVTLSQEQIAELNENSIWIIMDPWKNQEELFPFWVPANLGPGELNDWNSVYMKKIIEYLPKMKYPLVVTTEIDKSPKVLQNLPYVQHYPNKAGPFVVEKYLKRYNLTNIIYCGFHEQECIINRHTGYKNMSDLGIECYICKDLTCAYPVEGWAKVVNSQRLSPNYRYFNLI